MRKDSRYDLAELAKGMSPSLYLKSIGFKAFDWQNTVVTNPSKRIILMCSRQAGKSTIVSSIPCHSAKYYPKSLNVIIAPTEDQAKEDILKVKDYIAHDKTYPKLVRNASDEVELDNGSRIMVIIASDTAARGYSKPRTVVLDEASRIPDVVYASGVVPMLNNSPESRLYMLSTPFGQQGFFYRTWHESKRYVKIFVRTPWDVDPRDNTNLIPAMPEEQFKELCAEKGIIGMYSPNHENYDYQLGILDEIGSKQYRQEFCCEFAEVEGQVFSNADIDRFLSCEAEPLAPPVAEPLLYAPKLKKLEGGKFF